MDKIVRVLRQKPMKTYIPVYSTLLNKGISTRKHIDCQCLNSHVEIQIRDYLFTGKYFLPRIIKSQVYYP